MESLEKDLTISSLGQRLKKLRGQISNKSHIKGITVDKDNIHEIDEIDDREFDLDDLFEMARVEGYDDSSYIISSLKDIDRKLANGITSVTILCITFNADDVSLFVKLYKATENTASRLSDKVCWVLLGPTGAGKSTGIHYLCGSQFESSGKEGNLIVTDIHKSLRDKDIKIGESVTESKTRYIAELPLDLEELGIECEYGEPQKILFVDSPGFEDAAGPEVNMANGIGTIRALKKAEKIKIIITLKEAFLDYKCKIIRNIANNMGKAVKDLEHELSKPHNSPISGFLTKSIRGVDAAKATLNKAYKEQEQKDSDSSDNAIFKALLYKLGETGPLNEIKIDLENPQNNEIRRKQIIESLVKESGYIQAPNRSFNEFISEPTLSKLKQQIERDFIIIENILNHDQYFENPSYIQYIIDILSNVDRLRSIIRNSGGQWVESKLQECLDIFKSKWNKKIIKGQEILTKMELKEYGRGIDFKVFDKKLDLKGMHVELTYWPETYAEEIQVKGRTARQGQKGSFHIILNEVDVGEQYTPSCVIPKAEMKNNKNRRRKSNPKQKVTKNVKTYRNNKRKYKYHRW